MTANALGTRITPWSWIASKAAYQAGKPPIAVIEAHGAHDLNAAGNAWQKGYAVAKTHEKLVEAQDDL